MAPNTRTRRQRDISNPQPSIETPADSELPLSDNNNLSNNRESNSIDYEPDKTERHQKRRAISTPEPKPYDPETYGAWGRKYFGEEWYEYRNTLLREGKTHLLVLGEVMILPQPYNPDTYDPDKENSWTPEPEPYDPETYAAWGRKHLGDDWYEQRKTMLQERNFYMIRDPVYEERQRALRILEHTVEKRPFRPQSGVLSEDWKRLWARLGKDFLSADDNNNIASPIRIHDSDSDLSGYDTYDPTPEPREPTPLPHDPWERLEYNRRRFKWDEEEYQFERIFLKEGLIDRARSKREDDGGDKRRKEELEKIQKIKYLPGTLVKSGVYEDRMRKFDLRAQGWTQEQIEAADQADAAVWEWRQKNPEPRGSGLFGQVMTQEERDLYDAWLQKERAARLRIYGGPPPNRSGPLLGQQTQEEKDANDAWRRNIYARVSSQHKQKQKADATADASAPEKASRLQARKPRATKNSSSKTRGGRITKNTAQDQSVTHRGTQSQRTSLTFVQASVANRGSKRARSFDVVNKPDKSTAQVPQKAGQRQLKVYKKRASDAVQDTHGPGLLSKLHNKGQRASRRLAHEPPQYGMFAPSVRNPSDTSKHNSSGPHNRALAEKSIAAKSAKPQGISKPGHERTNRPKRSKKPSEG